MKVSEKSLELNVGAELLTRMRGPLNMPKAYLRGLTQAGGTQDRSGLLRSAAGRHPNICVSVQGTQRPSDDLPYTFTLGRDQHSSLNNLAVQEPGAVYYVSVFQYGDEPERRAWRGGESGWGPRG